MTHKAVDCVERPRKIGAKYSGRDIAADEVVQDITTTWDSKRDRWNGYEASEYKKVVDKFEEKQRRKIEDGEDGEEGEKEGEGVGAAAGDVDGTADGEKIKSLRERTDKASYLEDLSEDSALFNPKSRTLRTEDGIVNEKGQFERKLSEKALEYDQLRKMAEEVSEKGVGIHMEASPTEGILKLKQLQQQKETEQSKLKQMLLQKYGGEEHLKSRPKEVEMIPLEATITPPTATTTTTTSSTKSKYDEDIHPGNHTSVWGSYWKDGQWGFACCHSLVKHSYCLAAKGIEINDTPSKRTFDELSS